MKELSEPNLKWYLKESRETKGSPRCPFAAKNLCPRYDLTLELLHEAGRIFAYSPPEKELDYEILEPNFPYATGSDEHLDNFSYVCPEVMGETVGLFVGGYSFFPSMGLHEGDQWKEEHYYRNARHYSQCREYSIFKGSSSSQSGVGKRKSLAPTLRWKILQRDQMQCQYCGQKSPKVELQVDHKIPVSRGGTDDSQNLITSCRDCNQGKGAT